MNNGKSGIEESPAMQALQNTPEQSPFTDLKGNPVGLSGYVGNKVLVVSSWASWCPACVNSLKELSVLSDKYGDKIKILAINRSDPANTARAFLKAYNISDNVQLVLDEDDKYFKSVDGYNMPETIVYGLDGSIVLHKRGVTNVEELSTYIDNETRRDESQ